MRFLLGLRVTSRLRKRDTTAADENLNGTDNDLTPKNGIRQAADENLTEADNNDSSKRGRR